MKEIKLAVTVNHLFDIRGEYFLDNKIIEFLVNQDSLGRSKVNSVQLEPSSAGPRLSIGTLQIETRPVVIE